MDNIIDDDPEGWTAFNKECRLRKKKRKQSNELRGLDMLEDLRDKFSLNIVPTKNDGYKIFQMGNNYEFIYFPKSKRLYDKLKHTWITLNFNSMEHFFKFHYGKVV